MLFWSKGLGTKTLELDLAKGETILGDDVLYLKGDMEPPITWDYIMPMRGGDIVDFLELMRDPALPGFVDRSPERGRLYGAMVRHGLELALMIAVAAVRNLFGQLPASPSVEIQVPPQSVLEKRKKKKAAAKPARKPYRRRLSNRTTSAPSLTTAMREQHHDDEPESVEDAIQEAMQAASEAGDSRDA